MRGKKVRSMYEFGTDKENFGCVGSCGYAPDSVKCKETIIKHAVISECFILKE